MISSKNNDILIITSILYPLNADTNICPKELVNEYTDKRNVKIMWEVFKLTICYNYDLTMYIAQADGLSVQYKKHLNTTTSDFIIVNNLNITNLNSCN